VLSPDGKVMAEVSFWIPAYESDMVIRLWDVSSGKQLRALTGAATLADQLRFTPDGKVLASAGADGIRLWHVADGKQLHHLPKHRDLQSAFAFAPDGRQLVSIGGDRVFRVWEVATGKEVRRWDLGAGGMSALTWSPDGRWLGGFSERHFV